MKLKIFIAGFVFLAIVSCGETVVPEHKYLLQQEKEIISNPATPNPVEPLKMLNIEELNEKLKSYTDEDEFDLQTFLSVQKFEMADHFLVRVIEDSRNWLRILSWLQIKDEQISVDGKQFSCSDENGTKYLCEPVRKDFQARIEKLLVI